MSSENGNGDISINIEMNEMGSKNNKSFNELVKLIKKSNTEYSDISSHLKEIRDLLEKDAASIFGTDIKGKNIFHAIANQPDRNPQILSVFGLSGNSEVLWKYVSQQRVEELFYMKSALNNNRCPVHMAVANGFVQFVDQMLIICPSLVSAQDGDGNTPLHVASMSSMPEALECINWLLRIMERNQLVENLLTQGNEKGQTPIHLVCSKVPKNKSAQVVTKLTKLLSYEECNEDILKSVDSSSKTPLHLLCSKDDQSQDADKLKNVHDLMRLLIASMRAEAVNQPTNDDHKRTALHLLAISEFPRLMKILTAKHETNVTIKDAHDKMAIHYAAKKALNPSSQECVKILADWNLMKKNMDEIRPESGDLFRDYLLWDVYEENATKSTALTLACNSKSTITVEFILRNVFNAKKNFGTWFTGKDNDLETFSLKPVYKNTPAALEFLFDESFRIDLEKSNEVRVEFVTDISVITALAKPIQENQSIPEMKHLGYANKWPEDIQKGLLLHPLTQSTLFSIWQNMLPYKFAWSILNLIWLAAYWILVPLEYSKEEEKFSHSAVVTAWLLGLLSIFYMIDQLFAIKVCVNRLISFEVDGKLVWIQIVLTLISVYGPCLESVGLRTNTPPCNFQKLCAAGGVLLSFVLFWRNISMIYLPLGIHVEYLIQTLKQILKAFICIAAIIVGFQRAFSQILPQEFYSGTTWSFAKTLVMMTGEFDFGEMYGKYKTDDTEQIQNDTMTMVERNKDFEQGTFIDIGTWNLLMFILFLIILPVTFYNLITGMVVDKIKNMESKLEMYQIRNQIRLINYIQQTVVSKLDCIGCCFKCVQPFYVSYSQVQNGQVKYNQELRWYIDVEKDQDPSFWIILRNTFSQLGKCVRRADNKNTIFSGNFLPKSLRSKIFQMYKEKLLLHVPVEKYDSDIEFIEEN